MSLRVERLKELLAYETEWLAMFDHAAAVRGMAELEVRAAALHRDAEKAYSELLAIKEAEPVFYVHKPGTDDEEFVSPKAVNGHCPDCVPLIRKPE